MLVMDDAIALDEIDNDNDEAGGGGGGGLATAAPPRDADLRSRVAGWVERGRTTALAGVSAPYRLASLYFAQTRLIFPGRRTQGQPQARVRPAPGAELVALRTACGQDVAALFGPAASADGNTLPDAATRPTVLFFYGNGHYLANVHIEHLFGALRRIGVNVMIPEYVGYGLSGGDAGEAGCYATADAAYRHLLSRPDVDARRIVATGASLGGAVAIDLASRERAIAGLITLITFSSMADMARVVQPTVPIWRLIKHRFESESKMPRVACPTLIIHSTGDALVPYSMADRLAAACGGPVSRLRIVGAGHNSVEMLEGGGGDIYRAITAFLSKL
jgi:fermentation-respiration switch protein FrsA (DUF1100 family)